MHLLVKAVEEGPLLVDSGQLRHVTDFCVRSTMSQLVGLYHDVTPYLPHTSHGSLAAQSRF